MNKLIRDLKDTPFAIERLFVWALGAYMIIGGLGMVVLALLGKDIPTQLMTTTAVVVGIFGGRVERKNGKD